ncbi:MAG TPA: Fic family protein [Saprospiraceae bacterium]|nr:Fic family protein [Saprospiraceae bacterium]HMQ85086.1 Fic family protein [Saprospiraceae bacterium]
MTSLESPYNDLLLLPPPREMLETVPVLRQAHKAAAALGELKGLSRMLPYPNILLNAVILKEAIASSEIENVITTQDKLYQALSLKNTEIDPATKEVLRYREALLTGYRFLSEKGFISTNAIVKIQQVLEENSAGIRRLPGTALRNAATGTVIYTPPDNHNTLLQLMKNLEDYLHEEDDLSPFIRLSVQHYQFESIHPFYDGNGRTGRILNVLFLIMNGLLDRPILYLSKFIIAHKADYYRLLQEVRTRQNWEEWIRYMCRAVEVTALETIGQIDQINHLFELTAERIRSENPKMYSKDLVELLFVQPYCRIDNVIEQLGVSRPTASRYLKALSDAGILSTRQVWKETFFMHEALLQVLKA